LSRLGLFLRVLLLCRLGLLLYVLLLSRLGLFLRVLLLCRLGLLLYVLLLYRLGLFLRVLLLRGLGLLLRVLLLCGFSPLRMLFLPFFLSRITRSSGSQKHKQYGCGDCDFHLCYLNFRCFGKQHLRLVSV